MVQLLITRVSKKYSPFSLGQIDLPVRLADQHRLAVVDGDLGRADLNLERHGALPRLSERRNSETSTSFGLTIRAVVPAERSFQTGIALVALLL